MRKVMSLQKPIHQRREVSNDGGSAANRRLHIAIDEFHRYLSSIHIGQIKERGDFGWLLEQ
jgi:hypothetical protein